MGFLDDADKIGSFLGGIAGLGSLLVSLIALKRTHDISRTGDTGQTKKKRRRDPTEKLIFTSAAIVALALIGVLVIGIHNNFIYKQ
jgi:hypothetical protein